MRWKKTRCQQTMKTHPYVSTPLKKEMGGVKWWKGWGWMDDGGMDGRGWMVVDGWWWMDGGG